MAAPGTDPNAAWTRPRLYALNDKANGPVDFLHATSLQQPFRETHVVVECTVHDHKPMHPPATYILDPCTRDLRAQSLQDPTCLEIRACAHILSLHILDKERRLVAPLAVSQAGSVPMVKSLTLADFVSKGSR